MAKTKILFVCPYPADEAPSQRFRFEQYLSLLNGSQYSYEHQPFYSKETWKNLYSEGGKIKKIGSIILSFLKRFVLMFQVKKFDFIFIHREATPLGPPLFEWYVSRILKKRIIYDFDDAIWLSDQNERGTILSHLKWKKKVKKICSWSYKISCGNEYLADYAEKFNDKVIVNPTTIDTSYHQAFPNQISNNSAVTIGWTGTHSTLIFLEMLIPELTELHQKHPFRLLVISNQDPRLSFPKYEFIRWTKETEIEDLNRIDIGIMPLTDDEWSKGKCGFKALQYMACSKPVVLSAVGVNKEIVDHEKDGYLIKTLDNDFWVEALHKLLINQELRKEMGQKGREKVEKYYSVKSNSHNFLSLFKTNP